MTARGMIKSGHVPAEVKGRYLRAPLAVRDTAKSSGLDWSGFPRNRLGGVRFVTKICRAHDGFCNIFRTSGPRLEIRAKSAAEYKQARHGLGNNHAGFAMVIPDRCEKLVHGFISGKSCDQHLALKALAAAATRSNLFCRPTKFGPK